MFNRPIRPSISFTQQKLKANKIKLLRIYITCIYNSNAPILIIQDTNDPNSGKFDAMLTELTVYSSFHCPVMCCSWYVCASVVCSVCFSLVSDMSHEYIGLRFGTDSAFHALLTGAQNRILMLSERVLCLKLLLICFRNH